MVATVGQYARLVKVAVNAAVVINVGIQCVIQGCHDPRQLVVRNARTVGHGHRQRRVRDIEFDCGAPAFMLACY